MKAILAFLLTVVMIVAGGCSSRTVAPAAVKLEFSERSYVSYMGDFLPGTPPDGMEYVAQQGYIAMYFNAKTAAFMLEDMRTRERFYSALVAPDATLQESSPLIVTDLNYEDGQTKEVFGANAVVTTQKTKNGFQAWYAFQEEQFAIPVEYCLLEDGFRIHIQSDRIVERSADHHVAAVTVLPFFYAQIGRPNGFILVPDGSGAIMRLDGDKSNYAPYEGKLYGDSYLTVPDYQSAVAEDCLLPFMGLQGEKGGFLAMAETGASHGSVLAALEGQDVNASHVGFRFDLRVQQETFIGDPQSYTSKSVIVSQEGDIQLSDFSVRYFLLNSTPDTGLKEMAAVARNVVADRVGELKSSPDSAMYLSTLGAYITEEPVVGFRVKVSKPVTSFAQASTMINQLRRNGLEYLSLIYTGYNRDALRGKITGNLKPDMAVGSVKDMENLSKTVGDGRLFMAVNPVTLRTDGNGFTAGRSTIRDLTLKSVKLYRYQRNTTHADRDNPFYLLKTDVATTTLLQAESWLRDTLPTAGLLIEDYGNKLYGDYGENGYNREQALQHIRETLKDMSGRAPICTEQAYYEAAMYSSVILNVPESSSGYDVFDESVPFYQMVLSGTRKIVSRPINNAGNTQRAMLDCVRTGMIPHFELIAGEENLLGEHGVNRFYAASFEAWEPKITDIYKRYKMVYSAINGLTFEDYHMVQDGVYRLIYAGGVELLVNGSTQDVQVDGCTVAAGDFSLVA